MKVVFSNSVLGLFNIFEIIADSLLCSIPNAVAVITKGFRKGSIPFKNFKPTDEEECGFYQHMIAASLIQVVMAIIVYCVAGVVLFAISPKLFLLGLIGAVGVSLIPLVFTFIVMLIYRHFRNGWNVCFFRFIIIFNVVGLLSNLMMNGSLFSKILTVVSWLVIMQAYCLVLLPQISDTESK